jgi:hypothetical protein
MDEPGLPPMEPLAPIVDRMRELAREELPSPQTCEVRLFDDGTIRVMLFHSKGSGDREQVRYERTTGEILYEDIKGARWETETLSGGEAIQKPVFDSRDVQVLETVEPPYQ